MVRLPRLYPFRFDHVARLAAYDAGRQDIEDFIARVYRFRYGAELRSFLPDLLAFRDGKGALVAAAGARRASEGALFVEQYLDAPAENLIAKWVGRPVDRHEIVEVGNFAARSAGDGREVIVHLTRLLHTEGLRWVLLSATRQLRNAFDRLGLDTVCLADARSTRLSESDSHWGTYYATDPKVLLGDIAAGAAYIESTVPREPSGLRSPPRAACAP